MKTVKDLKFGDIVYHACEEEVVEYTISYMHWDQGGIIFRTNSLFGETKKISPSDTEFQFGIYKIYVNYADAYAQVILNRKDKLIKLKANVDKAVNELVKYVDKHFSES